MVTGSSSPNPVRRGGRKQRLPRQSRTRTKPGVPRLLQSSLIPRRRANLRLATKLRPQSRLSRIQFGRRTIPPHEPSVHACPGLAAGVSQTDSAVLVPSAPVNDDRPAPLGPTPRSPSPALSVRLKPDTTASPQALTQCSCARLRRLMRSPHTGSNLPAAQPHEATRRAREAPPNRNPPVPKWRTPLYDPGSGRDGSRQAAAQAAPTLPRPLRRVRGRSLEGRRGDLGPSSEDGHLSRVCSRRPRRSWKRRRLSGRRGNAAG